MELVSLTAFPKSGVTYLSSLLFYSLFQSGAPEDIEKKYVVDIHIHSFDAMQFAEGRGFYKNHYPFSWDNEHCRRAGKAVYLIRDPIDIMRSAHDFTKLVSATEAELSKDEFAERWFAGRGDHFPSSGPWPQHVRSWLEQTRVPVHLVRYKDLVEKPFDELWAIFNFLDLDPDSARVEYAVANSTMQAMRARENDEFAAKKPGVFYSEHVDKAMAQGARFINKGYNRTFDELNDHHKQLANEAFGVLRARYL